jgi:hypothetical protein
VIKVLPWQFLTLHIDPQALPTAAEIQQLKYKAMRPIHKLPQLAIPKQWLTAPVLLTKPRLRELLLKYARRQDANEHIEIRI